MKTSNLVLGATIVALCITTQALAGTISVSSYAYNNLGELNQVTGKDAPVGAQQSLIDELGKADDYTPTSNFWAPGQEGTIFQDDNEDVQVGQPQPSVTFDLGNEVRLDELVVHYGVKISSAVMAPVAVQIDIDSVPIGEFGGFDDSSNASSFGDIRSNTINLTGYVGQVVDMRFLGGLSTNPRAGNVSWLGLTEVEFSGVVVPEPTTLLIGICSMLLALTMWKRRLQ